VRADAQVVEKAVGMAGGLPALEICADVAGLRARHVPPRDAATAERARELASELARIRVLRKAGKYRDGLAAATAVADRARALGYEPLQAEASLALGELQVEVGNYRDGEANLSSAFWSALSTRNDEASAKAARDLVNLLGTKLGRLGAADDWGRHAAALLRRLPEGTEIDVDLHTCLGMLRRRQGRYEDAIAEHRRALAMLERFGKERNTRCSEVLNNLAVVYLDQGKYDQGESYLRRALAEREAVLGPKHPGTASLNANLGMVLGVRARYGEALEYLRRSLAIREQARGPSHADVARSQEALAAALRKLGKYEEAMALSRRALAGYTRSLGAEASEVAKPLETLSLIFANTGRTAEAVEHAERAVAIRTKKLGPNNPATAWVRSTLAEVYVIAERFTDAEREARASLEVMRGKGNAPGVGRSRRLLGEALLGRGESAPALIEARAAVAAFEGVYGKDHPETGASLRALGEALLRAGRPKEALAPLERAVAIFEKAPGNPRHQGRVRFLLAQALWDARGDPLRAQALARAARETLSSAAGRDPRGLARVDSWLARTRR
jgi:tetratricopeptide (TPR) repeat protein